MEDVQLNEVCLSRKGSAFVPRVCTTRLQRTPYRGLLPSHVSRPSRRARWPSRPNSTTEKPPPQRLVEIHLPPEYRVGAHGSHNARKRWIEDQKHHLWTNRHLSAVSFKYLDRDRSVLFACYARRATQSREHDSRDGTQAGPHPVSVHLDAEGTVNQWGSTAQSFVEAQDGDIVQNNERGSSRIGTTLRGSIRLGDCPQRLGNHSASGSNLRPVQAVHTKPVAPHRSAVDTVPTIDLILESGPLAEEDSARWSTFRSGRVNICLPPSNNGTRVSSSEASADPIPTPGQVTGPPEDTSTAHGGNTSPPPSQPDISMDDTLHAHSMQDHRIYMSLLDRYRRNVLNLDYLVRPCGRSTILADEAEVSSLLPDHGSLVRGFAFAGSNHFRSALMTNPAFGTAGVLKLDRNIRSTPFPFEECIDDACILSRHGEPIIVLGHAREQNQIGFLHLGCGQVSRHIMPRRGIMKSPLKFAIGGYGHRVHLWDIAQDLSGASVVELAIKHTSGHKLISVGPDGDVPIYDISVERVVQIFKMSCIPYHAHKTDAVGCTLLEVILSVSSWTAIFIKSETIVGLIERPRDLALSRRSVNDLRKWTRGLTCGDSNGVVHLWDLRNASRELAHRRCFNESVIQVVYPGLRLLACSKRNEFACIDLQSE